MVNLELVRIVIIVMKSLRKVLSLQSDIHNVPLYQKKKRKKKGRE